MSHYHTDHTTDKDALNYEDFRDALKEIVITAETPLTVGIFGAWGSGKSSLMQMLRKQVDALSTTYRTVWFTAWKYDRHETLWRAFILRVLDALYPRENGPGPRETRPIVKSPTKEEQDLIDKLNLLEQNVYQPLLWTEEGERQVVISSLLRNIGEAISDGALQGMTAGTVSTQQAGGKGFAQAVKDGAKNISKPMLTYHRQQLFYMEEFERLFSDVVRDVLGKEGRLIVFVDDLDRCLPEKAIAILEAIKLFLEVRGVIFVLGMDQTVIRKGIEAHYGSSFGWEKEGGTKRELPIRGDSYLQKLVQIPFHLPALGIEDVQKYITTLDDKLSPQTQAVIAQGVYPNPRQVKRVLNIHRLLRTIAKNRKEKITEPLLAKTVILQTQYPELYQLWRQYPTLVQTLEREYASRPSSDDERLIGRPHPIQPEQEGDMEAISTGSTTNIAKQGGLLANYLNDRTQYALLERMMAYPSIDQASEGVDKDRFEGLSREQVAAYVRLAGAIETAEPTPIDVDTPILEGLLSHEAVQIQDAVSRVPEEKKPIYQQKLVQVLQNPAQPMAERLSAGEALALLGDPRFYGEERFYLPQDDWFGFVEIPEGNFRMGSDENDPNSQDDEKPAHNVHLDHFYMARYPVTVAQFKRFVTQSGHTPANGDSLQGVANHPVRYVSWVDAMSYTQWLTKTLQKSSQTSKEIRQLLQQGWQITLPTEKQWEKAARGNGGLIYPWGNEFLPDHSNYGETRLKQPSSVGCFPAGASPYQLYDMSGNVWEWTRTIYNNDAQKAQDTMDSKQRENIVVRGGSYGSSQSMMRCACRSHWSLPHLYYVNGFRVCLTSISR